MFAISLIHVLEKRGREGQSRKCVGKTRSAEHSSPEKLCQELSGGGSIGRDEV